MRITDRYIAKQLLIATLFAIAILCGIFLLGTIFKQAKPLFVGTHPSPGLIIHFLASVIPFSLMFTIPWSFLAAILLVFGRLSSDNEITAMRMSGQSLFRVATPVFILATCLCAVCFWLNTSIAPKAKKNQKQLLFEAVREDPDRFLDPGVIKTNLKDQIIYVEAREGDLLKGLHVINLNPKTKAPAKRGAKKGSTNKRKQKNNDDTASFPAIYFYAEEATLDVDEDNNKIILQTKNTFIDTAQSDLSEHTQLIIGDTPIGFDFVQKEKRNLKAGSMTNTQLREEIKSNKTLDKKNRQNFEHEILKREAFSVASLAFAFVGIPLAMTSRRKETSIGFVISIGIGFFYFLFVIIADNFKYVDGPLHIIFLWLPNVLAILTGLLLFRKAKRT